jgi:hypothetical protein
MSANYPYIYNIGTSENILASYNQVTYDGQTDSNANVRNNIVQLPAFGSDYIILSSLALSSDPNGGAGWYNSVNTVVATNYFSFNSGYSNDTSILNWFLIVENDATNYFGTTVFLPWIDVMDPSQVYGKITLGDNKKATLTSKYLVGLSEAEARSRIFLTTDTPNPSNPAFVSAYDLRNYNSATGSFDIQAYVPANNNSVINYFIITKNDNQYIPTSGLGSYPVIRKGGSNATCGIAQLSNGSVTVNTTAALFNSIIIASNYAPGDFGRGLIYIPSAEIVPAVSFTIHSNNSNANGTVSWLIIAPASDNP